MSTDQNEDDRYREQQLKEYQTTAISRWPQPQDITRKDFHSGMLGMCEMESAAERIVALSREVGYWCPMSVECMADEHERTGFVELVCRGLLDKDGNGGSSFFYYYNGTFTPSKRLIEIMAKPERNRPLRQEDIA